jgi:hypothetical protein
MIISASIYMLITAYLVMVSIISVNQVVKDVQHLIAIILAIYWGLLCRNYILHTKEIRAREEKILLYHTLKNYSLFVGNDASQPVPYSSKITMDEFINDVYKNKYLRKIGTSEVEKEQNSFKDFLFRLCYMIEEVAFSDQDPLPREYRYIIKMIVKSFNEKKSNMFDVLAEAESISREIVIEKLVNS